MIQLVFNAANLRSAILAFFLFGYLSGLAALWMTDVPAFAAETTPSTVANPSATTPAASSAQIAEYQKQLAAYNQAQQQFHDDMAAYWTSISQKRAARNAKRRNGQAIVLDDYVLTQPPVYTGPPAPVNPAAPNQPPKPPAPAIYIPVVADFLKGAADKFKFVPRKPLSEIAFKKAYASVASPAGILKDQAVRIYGFEAGGNGTYDVQAGLEYNRPGAHAISTALGYNQLLSANSVELLAEQGDLFVKSLTDKAASLPGAQRAALTAKIQIVQQMIIVCKSVPDEWSEHVKLGNAPEGLGVHALNLDTDVGPLLQTQKLLNSIIYARRKGRTGALSAAELEMMNLSGDGNGFDMITIPDSWRAQVPTSNFFQQSGYEDNTVVIKNNVVSTLLAATNAKMDTESALPGAKDLAAAF
jgi:hypothetical protein